MTTIQQALQFAWQRHQARDYATAESIYQQVVTLNAGHADAWCYLGILYFDTRRYADSLAAYQQAVQLRPNFPIAHSNMGNTLSAMGRLEEAEASIRRALSLDPNYANAWTNLGAVLVKQGRLGEATEHFQQALELAPQSEPAHRNLGAALVRQGDLNQGQQHSEQALRLNPRSAEAHRNRAIVWLLTGDWERGWPEFEWRWQCDEQRPPNYTQPPWQGEPLAGKRLLMYAEQGLGDTIHFVRYARLAREAGAYVLVECQAPLLPLLRSYPHVDELVPRGSPAPDFDYHVALMSAPRLFGTRVDSIPADVPYLFAEPQRVADWKQRIAKHHGFKIGIAWQGSRDHPGDRDRSAPLLAFAPLDIPGVQWFSLQKGAGVEQLRETPFAAKVIDLGDTLDHDGAFLDTAALMMSLDLVITVDTALAHVAGALGVRTWLALAAIADWRWLQERPDTPWYPATKLFRQKRAGDWRSVFDQMRLELLNHLQLRSPG